MSKKDFRVVICSQPDRENLVAEISYKKKGCAEISEETPPEYVGWVEISAETPHEYVVCFCNTEEGNYWEFPYDEAMEILKEAKNRLAKYQRTPEEQAEYDAEQKAQENWKPTPEETA
uniref:Uncharacterized protein n=1 Tax=Candidatus Kentrum sp. SD TaxID=2126332 RepID=A0A451BRT7_9GAMM|nr:MAG: hypothetical protein BECKSD772D_GA0070982_12004 [Candidatus Kentron sp. SD]